MIKAAMEAKEQAQNEGPDKQEETSPQDNSENPETQKSSK